MNADIRSLLTCLTVLTVGLVRLTHNPELGFKLDQHADNNCNIKLPHGNSMSLVPKVTGSVFTHSLALNSRIHKSGKSSNKLSLIYICVLLIARSHDTHTNPGPTIYPCGYCELNVDWNDLGIQCDECDIWYHKSCYEFGDETFSALGKSNVSWICWKCGSQNLSRNIAHTSLECN